MWYRLSLNMGKILAATCCLLCFAVASAQDTGHLSSGMVIPKVICAGNPQQSYALYLPSTYSAGKSWPIIYAFDPGARGQIAVEAIRGAAEKSGYIVAASNNSRNGEEAVSTQALRAIWDDTQRRFSINERRRYFAGMSGGARLAVAFAISCKGCVAGVMANAAGFPHGMKPSGSLKFAYFAAVGDADFNFLEFFDLRSELEESGMQFRIRPFEGTHGWAPPDVWQEALNWMDLQAIRAGSLKADNARVKELYDTAMQRASHLLAQNDFLTAFREYQFTVKDFSGLTDTAVAQKEVKDLVADKRLKNARKQETAVAEDQRRIILRPSQQMQDLAAGNLSPEDFMALRSDLAALLRQTQASGAGKDPRLIPTRRALSGLVVEAFEGGQFAISQKKYDIALQFFDLAVSGSDNPGWAYFQRACVYAITSDKKHMLAELKQASSDGYHDVLALNAPEFQPFQSDPDFQEILRAWAAEADSRFHLTAP